MKIFEPLIVLSFAIPALVGCGNTGAVSADGAGGSSSSSTSAPSTSSSSTSAPSTSSSSTGASSTGAGTGGGVGGTPVCSGIIGGAPPDRQPLWTRCFALPFTSALNVDADGTVVYLNGPSDRFSLLSANGDDLGSAPIPLQGSQLEGADVAFAPSPSGGPSEILVDYMLDLPDTPSGSAFELVLDRLDRAGTLLWSGTASDSLSSAGNVTSRIAVGTSGAASLALTPSGPTPSCKATQYSALGAASWVVSLDPTTPCYYAAVDASGNTLAVDAHGKLYKLDPGGALLWTTSLGPFTSPDILGLGVDASGTATVGVLDFRGGKTPSPTTLVRVASDGSIVASVTYDLLTSVQFDVEADASGNTYLTGNIKAGTTFGNLVIGGSSHPVAIVKFDPTLTPIWATTIPDMTGQAFGGSNVRVDAAGEPYLWASEASYALLAKLPP